MSPYYLVISHLDFGRWLRPDHGRFGGFLGGGLKFHGFGCAGLDGFDRGWVTLGHYIVVLRMSWLIIS